MFKYFMEGGLVYMSAAKMWHDMIAIYMTEEAYQVKLRN